MSSAHHHEEVLPRGAPTAHGRACAIAGLARAAVDLAQVRDTRELLCAAAVVERAANVLGVALPNVTTMVERALCQVRPPRAVSYAIERYRGGEPGASVRRDLEGFVRVLRLATGHSSTLTIDLVEALAWAGHPSWAAEEAYGLRGPQRRVAADIIARGVRRASGRGGRDHFLGYLGNIEAARALDPSLALVAECVRRVAVAGRDELADVARCAAARLRGPGRVVATGYLVALTYCERGVEAALRESDRLCGGSPRDRALLLVVESALLRDDRHAASRVIGRLMRPGVRLRGQLDRVHWLFVSGRVRAARQQAARLALPRVDGGRFPS